jgi:hypothetical protein
MNIELTETERKFLAEFAAKQHEGAKGNVGTRTPIHVVERERKVFVEDSSTEVWVDDDNNYEAYESFEDLISARRRDGQSLPEYEDGSIDAVLGVWINSEAHYCKIYGINARHGRYVSSWEPIAFFLILDEAKRYKNGYQAHNCGDCRIYTYGLGYSNRGDMPVFRELLMRMGRQLADEAATAQGDKQ